MKAQQIISHLQNQEKKAYTSRTTTISETRKNNRKQQTMTLISLNINGLISPNKIYIQKNGCKNRFNPCAASKRDT